MSSTNQHSVVITNREIYDMVVKMKNQVAAMWVTHGIMVTVIGIYISRGIS